MSGFLYGRKPYQGDDIAFLKRQFSKILLDYYLVIISVIGIFFIFSRDHLSVSLVVKMFLTYKTIEGGEHLWYIPYCLLCYLMTPLLSHIFTDIFRKDKIISILVNFVGLSLIAILLFETFFSYFKSAWIFCYILGFFVGRLSEVDNKGLFYRNICVFLVVIAIMANAIQILQDYVLHYKLTGIIATLYSKYRNYAHVLLGFALFISLKYLFERVFKKGYPAVVKRLCLYSDQYAYDVYLVHQFVILGPFSLRVYKIISVNSFL